MKDRDLGGSPEFHHIDHSVVFDYLKKLVIEDNEAAGGKPLTRSSIESRINGSQAARRVIEAISPHNDAHVDYVRTQARLDKRERELAKAQLIASENLISNERAGLLGGKIIEIQEEADTAWNLVLVSNGVLHPRFQETHNRPGIPVDGEC